VHKIQLTFNKHIHIASFLKPDSTASSLHKFVGQLPYRGVMGAPAGVTMMLMVPDLELLGLL
jgi:hypothetical protein